MAERRLDINVVGKDNATPVFNKVQAGLQGLKQESTKLDPQMFSSMRDAGNALLSTIGLMTSAIGSFSLASLGLGKIATELREMAQASVEFNKAIETATLGIGTILSAQGKIYGSGEQLEGLTKLNAALTMSDEIVKQLRVDNLQTIATFDQLVKGYQLAIGPGLATGMSPTQVRKVGVAAVQAAGAIDPALLNQLGEEFRAMFTGDITRNSRLATTLGITPADIRSMQGDANKLFEFLMGKMDAFVVAGKKSSETFAGITSNLEDANQSMIGEAGTQYFENRKAAMQSWLDILMTVDETGKGMQLNPAFVSALEKAFWAADKLASAMSLVSHALSLAGVGASEMANQLKTGARYFERIMQNAGWGDIQPYSVVKPKEGSSVDEGAKARLEELKKMYEEYAAKVEELKVQIATPPPSKSGESITDWIEGIAKGFRAFQLTEAQDKLAAVDKTLKQMGVTLEYNEGALFDSKVGLVDFTFETDKANKSTKELEATVKAAAKAFEALGQTASSVSIDFAQGAAQELAMAGKTATEQAKLRLQFQYEDAQRKIYSKGSDAGLDVDVTGSLYKGELDLLSSSYDQRVKALGIDQGAKAGRKKSGGGGGPVTVEKFDQDIQRFQDRIKSFYSDVDSLDSEYTVMKLERSGQYFEAEKERITQQTQNQKEAWDKQVLDAEQAYKEMEQKLGGKKGATPEATKALEDLKSKWGEAKQKAGEYGDKLERNKELTLDIAKIKQEANDKVQIAQLNDEYTKLTGTMQEQYAVAVLLLKAERDRAMIEHPEVAGLISRNYGEKIKYNEAIGGDSFFSGFGAAADKWKNEIPTMGQMGADAFGKVTQAIDSAADALTNFVMTGKMDFTSFATSIITDLIRMQIRMQMMQMLGGGSGGGFGGGFGSLLFGLFGGGGGDSGNDFGILHGGGVVGETQVPVRRLSSSVLLSAPRLHNGLRAGEFPAILEQGERVIPKGTAGSSVPKANIVINNNGRPVEVTDSKISMNDMKDMQIELTIDLLTSNGAVRTAVQDAARNV